MSANPYLDGWSDGWRPDPLLTVSQWADSHRFLSAKSASEPGRWRTSRAPYCREPMDELSAYSPTERVILMFGAQTGKTETGNNFVGYVIHHAPAPMLVVQPTLDMAKRLSKQRIGPMLMETPVLAERVAEARSRDSGNTIMVKEFLGGVLVLTGANSAVGLRSMPVRFLFLDEVDAFPADVEGEGDPVSLAEKRTTTFNRRKILITSTPTIKDASRVEREYERSDKRKYYVPCPHCGHYQWLRWRGFNDNTDDPRAKNYRLVWIDEERTRAGYVCEECTAIIEEKHKTQMLERGEWRPTAPGDGKTKGYHLSSLYSPAGWKSWVEVLREFEESAADPAKLKTFVNTVLAETWEEAYSAKLDAEGIAKRAELYNLLTVPEPAVVITAGIDVQDNRIEIVQRAWGEGEESWLVNYIVIHGDPAKKELWDQVLDVLDTPLEHASGAQMATYAAAIDSGGHFTHEVYAFARAYRKRHILAVKGQSLPGKPALGKPTRQDLNIRQQTIKKGAQLWPVGSDTIKALIYGRLKNTEKSGPGVYHWPAGLPEEYWKQLTAEKQVTRLVNGFPKRVWIKKDRDRNEALDCEVYAYAALQYVYTRHNRNTIWQQMRAKITQAAELLKISRQIEGQAQPVKEQDNEPIVAKLTTRPSLKGWRRG